MDTIFCNGTPILSIIALCISVISVITSVTVSVISIRKQEKANQNKFKPFCAIYQANYDNFISVGIKNDGVGPLIITELTFTCDNCSSAKSLFDLLPESIKHTTYHRLYARELRQRALLTNERLHILTITPENNNIMQEIRNLLKTITVKVKYTDVYGICGKREKKLDLFNLTPRILISDEGRGMFF
jgi:hypothetical protein